MTNPTIATVPDIEDQQITPELFAFEERFEQAASHRATPVLVTYSFRRFFMMSERVRQAASAGPTTL